METFAKLLGSLLALVYHCFDRIVILGHRPLLTRPENVVHFFRDLHQVSTISKEVLRQPTNDYHCWVEAFAKKHHIPLQWAEKGVRKEDDVRPHLRRLERQISSESTSSSRAWNWDPPSVPPFPGSRWTIPITASSPASAPATPTTTSISAMKGWGRSPYVWDRSYPFPSPTTSTTITSSNANGSARAWGSARKTMLSSGWPMPKPYRRQPTASAPRSFVSRSITGLGW